MSRSRRLSCPVLVVAALLLAGCGSTVAGRAIGSSGPGSSSGAGSAGQDGARFTDPVAIAELSRDVSAAVTAVNTYDYRDVAGAKRSALRYVTGSLTADLTDTYDDVIAKNAPGLRAVQRARVNALGVTTLRGDTATLLVFGALTITTRQASARVDSFTADVTATKVGDSWKASKIVTDGRLTGTPPGTAELARAATAAGAAAAAVSSFTRAGFDAEFERAIALLGGSVRREFVARRAELRRTITTSNIDVGADTKAVAVESAGGSRALMLVSLTGYRIQNGTRQTLTPQRLRLTTTLSGGRWLVTDLESVGTS